MLGETGAQLCQGALAPPRRRTSERARAWIGRLVEDAGNNLAPGSSPGECGVIAKAQVIAKPNKGGHGIPAYGCTVSGQRDCHVA